MKFTPQNLFEPLPDTPGAISVSEYIASLNERLKECGARIIGEASEVKVSHAGHVFFTLKDANGESVLPCVIWKSTYELAGIALEDGLEIMVSGYPDVYPRYGKLTFKADTIELVGEGALKKAYEKLKKKLEDEGLFDPARKRPLPLYPQKIGVITSKQGAVIHDFLNNLGTFGFKIVLIDSRVEGQQAVKDLLSSLRSFKKQNIEALVIIRGGGSFESLAAFNNETLVREIAAFPVPVIAGIGHHRDVSLAALAADAMESTPTAVAHLFNRSWEQARLILERSERNILEDFSTVLRKTRASMRGHFRTMDDTLHAILKQCHEAEYVFRENMSKTAYVLSALRTKIAGLGNSAARGCLRLLDRAEEQVKIYQTAIRSHDPNRQLRLGYSIAWRGSKVIKTVRDATIGESFDLHVSDGVIDSRIEGMR